MGEHKNRCYISASAFLKFVFPEEYIHIPHQRNKEYLYIDYEPAEVIVSPDGDCKIQTGCHPLSFSSKIFGSMEDQNKLESKVKSDLKKYNYSFDGFVNKTIDGKNLQGVKYTFTDKGVNMYGETYSILINGKFLHLLSFFTDMNNLEKNKDLWDSMCSESTWRKNCK